MKTNDSKLWEELYAAAVLETDPAKIADRIREAQDAIRQQWQALATLRAQMTASAGASKTPCRL